METIFTPQFLTQTGAMGIFLHLKKKTKVTNDELKELLLEILELLEV